MHQSDPHPRKQADHKTGLLLSATGKAAAATTINFLNIRTTKTFVVITLKFELCGSTIE